MQQTSRTHKGFRFVIAVFVVLVAGCAVPPTVNLARNLATTAPPTAEAETRPAATPTSTPTPTATATPVPLPEAGDIHIQSQDGWEAWTHSTDYAVVHQEWNQVVYVRPPNNAATSVWRVSNDVRQAYYLPVAWALGTHLILAGVGANCSSCWSWGLPLATINAETGQVTKLDASMLLTSEAYAFSPTQPGLLAIAQGGSRYLLDGMRLALLDLTTGKRRDLTDPAMTAFEPAWSPDGKLIAYAAVRAVPHATGDGPTLDRLLNGRAIYILNPETGQSRALTQPGEQAMDGWPHWTSDGTYISYARRYADRTEVREISRDGKVDKLVRSVAASPMCNYAGCGWSYVLGTVPLTDDPVYRLAWSPDSKTIAAATAKGIVLFDASGPLEGAGSADLSPLRTIGPGGEIESLAYSPDGTRLACTCDQGHLKIWDAKSGELLKTLTDEKGFTSVAFSPDGAQIAGGTWNGSVKVWDAQGEKLLLTLPGPEGDVDALAYSPDSREILSGSSLSGTVRVWDANSGQVLHAFPDHRGFVGIEFSPDGRRMAASNIGGDSIKVWDVQSGALLSSMPKEVVRFTFSPDGKEIVCACKEGLVAWDADSGLSVRTIAPSDPSLYSIAFSPDGKLLAEGTRDGKVKTITWSPPTRKPPSALDPNFGYPLALGNTWVYASTRYDGFNPSDIMTATQTITETVVEIKNDPSFIAAKIRQETSADVPVSVPKGMEDMLRPASTVEYWLVAQGGRIYRQQKPNPDLMNLQDPDSLELVFPLQQGDTWNWLPARLPFESQTDGIRRQVLRTGPVFLPSAHFDNCALIKEDWADSTVEDSFCPGVGWVEKSSDHNGTPVGRHLELVKYRVSDQLPALASGQEPMPTLTPYQGVPDLVACPGGPDTDEACLPDGNFTLTRLVGYIETSESAKDYPVLTRGVGKSPVLLNDPTGHPYADLLRGPSTLMIVEGLLTSLEPPTLQVRSFRSAARALGPLTETYTNTQIGFAINYPSGWIVEDDTSAPGGIVTVQNYHTADLPFRSAVDPALYKVEIVPIQPSQAATLAEMRAGIQGKVMHELPVTIANLSAIRLQQDTESHGSTDILLVQLSGRVLLLQTWQEPGLFDKMIQTLRPVGAANVPTPTPTPPQTSILDVYPLGLDATWIYSATVETEENQIPIRWTSVVTETITSVREQGGAFVFDVERRGGPSTSALWLPSYQYVAIGNRLYRATTPSLLDSLIARQGQGYEGLQALTWPLNVGDKWGGPEDIWRGDGTLVWRVQGKEDLETPAGTFSGCYRLLFLSNPDDTTVWFCPGVGIARREYHHHGSVLNEVWELQDRVPGGALAPSSN
ncbi:MAG: hypothetical protein M1132_11995 [Chloroflexi bacterium]|nr:hypothetical protein [Chloroflexota bacterium]